MLTLNFLDVEYQEDCLYDYIILQNETEETPTKLCTARKGSMFFTKKNTLIITFRTDYRITAKGFFMHWTSVDMDDYNNKLVGGSNGSFDSPNYPFSYLPNLKCTTMIQVPKGMHVLLKIEDFILTEEECNDNLMIYLDQLQKNITLCGIQQQKEMYFLSTKNELVTEFTTDQTNNSVGFKASYEAGMYTIFANSAVSIMKI